MDGSPGRGVTYEIWFSYKESRRFRVAVGEAERADALAYLNSIDGVTDIDPVETQD